MTYTTTTYQSIYDVSHERLATTAAAGSIAYLNNIPFDTVFDGLQQILIDDDFEANQDQLTEMQRVLNRDKRVATCKLPSWAPVIVPDDPTGIGYMIVGDDNQVG